jgi:uncharacterized membrane protein YcaP (DUF421 family)
MNELLSKLFVPSGSVAEIVIRGTLLYFALFLFMRLLKRQSGAIGISDLLVVVLIADAAQNAMAADYSSVTEGVALVATIVFWDYVIDWLGHRFPRIGRFVHPPPLPLVRDGRLLRRNMRSEMISEDELMTQLREQGADELAKVKAAYMEGDGHISVIKHDGDSGGRARDATLR